MIVSNFVLLRFDFETSFSNHKAEQARRTNQRLLEILEIRKYRITTHDGQVDIYDALGSTGL